MDTKLALEKAEELAYQEIAKRCKVDLYYLCKYILGYDIIDPFTHGQLCAATRPIMFWRHKEIANAYKFPSDFGRSEEEGMPTKIEQEAFYRSLENFIPGDRYSIGDKADLSLHQLLALMPRGTLKTSVVTIGLTLQFFLNYTEERVLISSETVTKAQGFLSEIKGHIEDNDKYRKVFKACHGEYPGPKNSKSRWSNSQLELCTRKKGRKEPSIDVAGVDVTKNGMHYDLIIFDDLHSEINTQTTEQIDKVINHFKLAYSLLDPGCPVIVIGTRWSYTDLYQYIIDERKKTFNFITRSAVGEDGSLLYPTRLTKDFLDEQREGQGSYIFSCQYLNDPVDSETAKFKKSWFQYTTLDAVSALPMNWYLTVDPGGDGKTSDFAAFVISGMDYQSNIYVRYVARLKLSDAKIVEHIFNLCRKFNIRQIAVEAIAAYGVQLQRTFNEKMREMGYYLPVKFITSRTASKQHRIEALAPKYEWGKIFHIKGAPGIDELEDELIHFPKAKNDDAGDALSTVLDIAAPPMRNRVQQASHKDRAKLFKKLNTPRSPSIGY